MISGRPITPQAYGPGELAHDRKRAVILARAMSPIALRVGVVAAMLWSILAADAMAAGPDAEIDVLSNRADLVSGGDALVAVDPPSGASPDALRVRLNGNDVTDRFAVRADGRFEGLLRGLRLGRNELV